MVRAIWRVLRQMGFDGGRVLEPGCGTGLFFALAPEPLSGKLALTGVEMDATTARIAKLLYPNARIRREDFTKARLPEHYDLAVGNPPFSDRTVRADDPAGQLRLSLHDYFIARSVERLRPGGLAAFVTSRWTMDKVDTKAREHISGMADLIGAVRHTRSTRTKLVQSIMEGGRLTHDAERLRVVARQMLANVLSCSLGRSDSGLVARIAGDALGADTHIGNMATEDFLGCLSKAGIEKVGSSLRVLPRPRAKETRAEVIKQASGTTYVHPAALFALTEAEIALHAEAVRDYSSGHDDPGEGEQGVEAEPGATESGGIPGPMEPAICMPTFDPDDLSEDYRDPDENAHLDTNLDEDEAPDDPRRRRPSRRKHAATV